MSSVLLLEGSASLVKIHTRLAAAESLPHLSLKPWYAHRRAALRGRPTPFSRAPYSFSKSAGDILSAASAVRMPSCKGAGGGGERGAWATFQADRLDLRLGHDERLVEPRRVGAVLAPAGRRRGLGVVADDSDGRRTAYGTSSGASWYTFSWCWPVFSRVPQRMTPTVSLPPRTRRFIRWDTTAMARENGVSELPGASGACIAVRASTRHMMWSSGTVYVRSGAASWSESLSLMAAVGLEGGERRLREVRGIEVVRARRSGSGEKRRAAAVVL